MARQGADPRDVATPAASDEVLAWRIARPPRPHELPPEQRTVEGQCSAWIGLQGLHPAGNAGRISLTLAHAVQRSHAEHISRGIL